MKKVLYLFLILLLLSAGPALSAFGLSNLGFSGYPKHSCYPPSKPFSDDEWAWERFKSDATQFERCINDYLEAAENDQRRIVEGVNDAVSDYNFFVRSL